MLQQILHRQEEENKMKILHQQRIEELQTQQQEDRAERQQQQQQQLKLEATLREVQTQRRQIQQQLVELQQGNGTTTTDAYEINESQESCAPGILDEEDTKHVKQLLQFMADKLASNKLQYRDEWNKNPATAVRDLVGAWAEEAFPELSPEDRASWVNAQWGPEKRPGSRRLSSSSDHSFWSQGPSFWSFSDGLD